MYGIKRNEEFVSNMDNILSLSSNPNHMQQNLFFLLHSGDVKQLCKFLISYSHKVDLSKCDPHGMNAFHYCCHLANVRMFELFVDVLKHENEKNGKLKLKECLTMPTKAIMKQYCLHLAINSGSTEMVKKLIHEADLLSINFGCFVDYQGFTGLSKGWRLYRDDGRQDIIKVLLNSSSYIDMNNEIWFMTASLMNNEEILKCFVESQSVKNDTTIFSKGLLGCAATYEHSDADKSVNFKCFKILLEQKEIDVNIKDENGCSVFFHCVERGKLKCLQYLLDKYNVNQDCLKNNKNKNVLHIAAQSANYEMLRILLTKVESQNLINEQEEEKKKTPLLVCTDSRQGYDAENPIECNHFKCFKLLLSQPNIDVNIKDESGYCAFLNCFNLVRIEYIKFLYENSNRNNYKWKLDKLESIVSMNNRNGLHQAVKQSSYEILKYCLECTTLGSNTNALNMRDKDGRTPLTLCVRSRVRYDYHDEVECDNSKCFKILLQHKGIDVNIIDKNGYSALLFAVREDKLKFVRYMVENKDRIDLSDNCWTVSKAEKEDDNGFNSIHIAARGNCDNTLKYLLELKKMNSFEKFFNINQIGGKELQTPLHIACDYKLRWKCFKILVDQVDVDVNILDKNGQHMMAVAILDYNVESVEYILNKFVNNNNTRNDLDNYDNDDDAKYTSPTATEQYLDMNWKDADENNFLMIAAQEGQFRILSLLLKTGFYDERNINDVNKDGYNVLELVAMSEIEFDTYDPLNCDNYKCFGMLIQQKGINVNENVLQLYRDNGKEKYLSLLKI